MPKKPKPRPRPRPKPYIAALLLLGCGVIPSDPSNLAAELGRLAAEIKETAERVDRACRIVSELAEDPDLGKNEEIQKLAGMCKESGRG